MQLHRLNKTSENSATWIKMCRPLKSLSFDFSHEYGSDGPANSLGLPNIIDYKVREIVRDTPRDKF